MTPAVILSRFVPMSYSSRTNQAAYFFLGDILCKAHEIKLHLKAEAILPLA